VHHGGIAGSLHAEVLHEGVEAIRALRAERPELTLWLDDGMASLSNIGAEPPTAGAGGPWVPVIGSETGITAQALARLEPPFVLSLDHGRDGEIGDRSLFADEACWPERIIVMTLARVGTASGPDLDRVGRIVARAGPGRRVYAAGGVRDRLDVAALMAVGAAGALVSSAVHGGALRRPQTQTGDLG